jgi:hypothetical protein
MNIPSLTISSAAVHHTTVRDRRQAPWTARQLGVALSCLPDDTPITALVATQDEGLTEKQIVTGIDFGLANSGDRPEGEPALLFAILCERPGRSAAVARRRQSHSARHGR